MIAPNCKQYNGVSNTIITHEGYFDDKKRQPVIDKKTKEAKPAPHPEFMLFEKCMRGDTSDNVFSAFPGVRTKGTKNKVGLIEAFEDKDNKGFNWNNFMLQKWVDHEGVEHRVLDDYQRNREIIDLTAQPDNIKTVLDETIVTQVQRVPNTGVGVHFMKFCGKHDLQRISATAEAHAEYLNAAY